MYSFQCPRLQRARILHAEPLDAAAAKTTSSLRITVRDDKPIDSIRKRLDMSPPGATSSGEITVEMILDMQTAVTMKLPGKFPLSPQIAGALKAVSGVVDVQMV